MYKIGGSCLIVFFGLFSFQAIGQIAISSPTVTGVTTTDATLGGDITSGPLTHRGTRWNTTSPVGTSNQQEEATATTGVFTQARTGLPPASKIFFVAYGRNSVPAEVTTSETVFFTEPAQLIGGQFTAAATSESAITLTFPSADSWEGSSATGGYVIFRNSGSAPSLGALADGAAPPADGVGDKIATISDGSLTSFNNNSGLSAETDYYYTIIPFVWDGSTASTYNYNMSSPQTANDFTFSLSPTNHPTNGTFTVSAVSSTQINLAFDDPTTLGNSDGYIILRRQDGVDPTTANIVNGVDPATLAGLLPAGTTLAGVTSATSFNNTSLTAATEYRYLIIPYNSNASLDAGTYSYKTGGTPVTPKNDWTFATEPSGHATGSITATPASSTQINLSFNSITTSAISNATGYIVLIKSSAIVVGDLATLTDGAVPTGFGLYQATINSTSASTHNVTGLSPNTTYHFAIIPFNRVSNDETYNYLTTTGFAIGNATTNDISATITPITVGSSPVVGSTILTAGSTLQVLYGFSVTSDGTQEITDIGFNYTGTVDPTFTDEYLYRSTVAGSVGSQLLSDNSPDGNFSLTSVSVGNKTINSTPVYYYLVVDVSSAVTSGTSSVSVNPSQANISVNTGLVNNFSSNTTFTFSASQISDIVWDAGTTDAINYRSFQSNGPLADNASNSVNLGEFLIRDGGAGGDGDNKPTNVTSVTISLTNFSNVRRIALFDDDGDFNIAGTEQTVTGATVTFTPSSPIVVADDTDFRLEFRATFQSAVTDNQEVQITITGITANSSGSGFVSSIGTPSTTSDAPPTNRIAVVASKFIYVAPLPGATPINTNFGLVVRAVDGNPQNNRDLDYNGQVDLTASGGPGTLSALGGELLDPTLTAGQYTWTQLRINQAGSYTLDISDDAYSPSPDLGDASTSITISSSPSNITTASASVCYGNSSSASAPSNALGNIVITETDAAGISGATGSYTFSLSLPSGFEFDQSVTTGLSFSVGSDLSSPSAYTYPGVNVVQFSFTLNGTANINTITIGGLRVWAPHPGTVTPAPVGPLNITRLGGTANIAGVTVGTVLGSVSASQTTPAVTFTVAEVPGDVVVDPGTTSFNTNSNAVILNGSITPGVFSGSGVTFVNPNYRFNPGSLAASIYPITYTHTNASGCQSVGVKDFTVFVSGINGLAASYCNNDAASGSLSVDQTFIDARTTALNLGTGWFVDHYVYYDPNVLNFVPITTPANNIFDPKLPAYQSIAQIFGGQIPIGFAVCDGVGVPCNGASTTAVFSTYQWVQIKPAPTVGFTMPGDDYVFCEDDAPVILTGTPPNSNNTVLDKFDAGGGQASSVTNALEMGNEVWRFSPAVVSGVAIGASQTFSITYTYTDPVTACDNTFSRSITVHARPTIVPTTDITKNPAGPPPTTTIELCEGTTVGSFSATDPTYTYRWYSNPPGPANLKGVGANFTPPVDNLVPQTTAFHVTRELNGCESIGTPLALSVVVNPSPTAPVPLFPSNLTRQYCVGGNIDENHLNVPGTQIKWYDLSNSLIHTGNTPTVSDLSLSSAAATTYSFNVTNTVNTCEGSSTLVTVTIKPLPVISIDADNDPTQICTTGGIVRFSAFDQSDLGNPATNGAWSGTGLAGSLNPFPTLGEVELNPTTLAPGPYVLQYNYTNSAGCANTGNVGLTILPVITPNVSVGNVCNGSPAIILNNSTISAGASTISSAEWVFGDGSVLPSGLYADAIDPTIHSGNTIGTYESPQHIYPNVGTFQLQGRLTSSDGCLYTIPPTSVTVSPVPIANFTWANVCQDSPTQFAATVNLPDGQIQSYNWNFAKNSLLNGGSASGKNTSFIYTQVGQDIAELTVTSNSGCSDVVEKPIYIVPNYTPISTTDSYTQDFSTSGGWITGGINSSWELGIPELGKLIQSDNNIWETKLTAGPSNSGESSWVLSGCFDFSNAIRPVISLDTWSDTPDRLDGAVLQFNENGNIESDASWSVIGTVGSGTNWYNGTGIANSPGNQSAGDIGWTGTDTNWKESLFKLDNLIGKPKVVFRVAFASNQGQRDGFAFDNIFIGERSRIVLLESFVNSSNSGSAPQINFFNNFGSGGEVVKVQYHTPFPGSDPINETNSEVNNSRTAFYGIVNTNQIVVDGLRGNGQANALNIFNDRVLTPARVEIGLSASKVGADVAMDITLRNPSTTEPLDLGQARIFVVVLEKVITDPALLNNSGVSQFSYVAKDMLPSAAGIEISSVLSPGGTYNASQIIWNNPGTVAAANSALAIFVQNINGNNKNVYQSILIDNPLEPDVTTGLIENANKDSIKVYPNPADHEITVALPSPAVTRMKVQLASQLGVISKESAFEPGEQTKSIDTKELAAGIYILQLGDGKDIVRKKVMVVHK